jgi:hypothetical protein
MAKVTGIGGVFFKATADHKRLAQWYSENLGTAGRNDCVPGITGRLPLDGLSKAVLY